MQIAREVEASAAAGRIGDREPNRKSPPVPLVEHSAANIGRHVDQLRDIRPIDLNADPGTGSCIAERTALIHEGLRELIARESARRLAKLGGTERQVTAIPRRKVAEP